MVLNIQNLSKSYAGSRKKAAFQLKVDELHLQPGSFTAILGPNGSGKSTLIKIITDLVYADSGSVQLLGHDHKLKEARRGLSYLPEHFSFPQKLTVRQMLHAFADISGADKQTLKGDINRLAKAFNVDYLNKKMKDLSKGMRQTAALLHTFVGDNAFYILDEPFNGLDAVQKKAIMGYILERQQSQNCTILMTTHILSDIEKTCDHLHLIKDGTIINSSTKDDITQQHGSVEAYYLNHFDPQPMARE